MLDPAAALEAQLRANPDDDTAWKVYADLLSAAGDVRGELILLERDWTRRHDPNAQRRIVALTNQHTREWEPADSPAKAFFEWRHGFVWELKLQEIGSAQELAPLARLLADPQARLLTDLHVNFAHHGEFDRTGERLYHALAQVDLSRLRVLQLAYHKQARAAIRAITSQPTLALEILDLRYSGLGDYGMRRLASSERLVGLRELRVHGNQVGPAGVEALARSTTLANLELLDLRANPIGLAGAQALANSPTLRRLQTLHVHPEDVTPDGVRALAASTELPADLVRFWRGVERKVCR